MKLSINGWYKLNDGHMVVVKEILNQDQNGQEIITYSDLHENRRYKSVSYDDFVNMLPPEYIEALEGLKKLTPIDKVKTGLVTADPKPTEKEHDVILRKAINEKLSGYPTGTPMEWSEFEEIGLYVIGEMDRLGLFPLIPVNSITEELLNSLFDFQGIGYRFGSKRIGKTSKPILYTDSQYQQIKKK